MLSKKATFACHGEDSSYFLGWQEYEKDPYDVVHNPSGIIQLGLAENQLSMELLESWLAKNSHVTSFKENGGSIFKELALFQDYHGLPTLKKELAEFMEEIRGKRVKLDPKKIVMTAGSTSANETLMFCLAEPGDAFLIPTPYYPGYDRDLKWRTGVEIVPVQCSSSTRFKLTTYALEDAYQRAQKLNLKVKGVLITNPSNPLGTTMTKDEIGHVLDFAVAKSVHVVSDEIFSATVFHSPRFISVLDVLSQRKHQEVDVRDRVHVVYSLSKDLGLSGFRVGAIYSNNEMVVSAATKMSSFGLVSSQTQHLVSTILGDKTFMRFYLKENLRRLGIRREALVLGLAKAGIRSLSGNAGLFCWVDMRHLLKTNTFDAEIELWNRILFDVKINISPGSSCHCAEPGWFRICFANVSKETLWVAMRRLRTFTETCRDKKQCPSVFKWVFELALYDCRHER